VGRFEIAASGTLFLDEIGDMPPPLQVKLLRVLQERAFERVGESVPRPMDVRVIAATHVDLKDAIAAGRFREDLYYRLRVVPIHIPPLRERPEDIEPLARHLLARIAAREGRAVLLSPDALDLLKHHTWGGNVRELENAIEYAVAVCQRQTVQLEDLPPEIVESAGHAGIDAARRVMTSDEAQRIRAVLEAHHWHHARAAAELGISRTTLWRRMRALGLT
jgi:transcriptional regulator with PAS, ATPase and Fis domain